MTLFWDTIPLYFTNVRVPFALHVGGAGISSWWPMSITKFDLPTLSDHPRTLMYVMILFRQVLKTHSSTSGGDGSRSLIDGSYLLSDWSMHATNAVSIGRKPRMP